MESRQVGVVRSLSGDHAVVQVRRQGGCSGKCSHGQIFGDINRDLTIEARNLIGARVGDWVQIAYDGGLVLRAALAIYILPILLGIASYLLSHTFLADGHPVLVGVVTAVVFVLSLALALRHYSRSKWDYRIVATADVASLPLAPGCQGCGLATIRLDE